MATTVSTQRGPVSAAGRAAAFALGAPEETPLAVVGWAAAARRGPFHPACCRLPRLPGGPPFSCPPLLAVRGREESERVRRGTVDRGCLCSRVPARQRAPRTDGRAALLCVRACRGLSCRPPFAERREPNRSLTHFSSE